MTVPYDGEYLRDPRQGAIAEARAKLIAAAEAQASAYCCCLWSYGGNGAGGMTAILTEVHPACATHGPVNGPETAVEATEPGGETPRTPEGSATATAGRRVSAWDIPGIAPDLPAMTTVDVAALDPMNAELDRLREAVGRVRELHQPVETRCPFPIGVKIQCQHCLDQCHSRSGLGCDDPYDAAWPCPTIQALGEEA